MIGKYYIKGIYKMKENNMKNANGYDISDSLLSSLRHSANTIFLTKAQLPAERRRLGSRVEEIVVLNRTECAIVLCA